ncbi:MAG: molybdopterin cofactor-binding domain-containing protein, partial [Rudaea sp.]
STRPQSGDDFVAGQAITGRPAAALGWYGGGDRNAPTDYRIHDQRVTIHWIARSPLRASSMRSLGGTANTFANESFMDELAAAAHRDPLEFRSAHLADPRARAVLQAAADRADWKPRGEKGRRSDGPAVGQGIAFARYKNSEAYLAAVAQVLVDPATGHLEVKRIVVAFDCGLIINPDGLRNQIEGNVIQSLSRALKEEVRFDERRILSLDWESYPILTFTEVPDVEVALLDRPQEPAVGAGEPASITTAPAVANAIFDATGARLRRVPFTAARIREAMCESAGT